MESASRSRLAILGGKPVISHDHPHLFQWPIITSEDKLAVLEVVSSGTMSGINITQKFEEEWGSYLGTEYNLGHCNGTASLYAAMFAVGLGRGDEMIVPSLTYWASALQAMSLGATPVFADIDPVTLTIDPDDIERRITPRTRALMVVHYCGHPCDMNRILPLVRRHKLKLIEDLSHAQGALYDGKKLGTFGDAAGISMMSTKSFAIGEAGMLSTNDRLMYERAVAFGHYDRTGSDVKDSSLRQMVDPDHFATGLPLGGIKARMNQTCAAMGRVQLKHYQSRIEEIQTAMNYFWDLLEGVPGIRPHRVGKGTNSTMGGWFNPLGHYVPEELDGLPVNRFIDAVKSEGVRCGRGANFPLHLHPLFNSADVYNDGKPTRIAFACRDVRQCAGSLPVTESLGNRVLGVPWFKHHQPELIEQYAEAFRKVATNASQLAE